MKNKAILLFLFILFSCNTERTVDKELIEATKTKINGVIELWHLNVHKAKYEEYFNAMSENAMFYGTDVNEVWTKQQLKKHMKPYFDRKATWWFKTINREVYLNKYNDVAWFNEIVDTWMGICRCVGILTLNEDNEWKIESYTTTLTIPNENLGKVIKMNKKIDSVFIKTYQIK